MTVVRSGWSFMSVENNRAIPAQEHAVFKHQFERAGEDNLFHVAASLRHARGAVRVINGNPLLPDDRPLIKLVRNEVSRRADHLHAASKRLLVRLRADE